MVGEKVTIVQGRRRPGFGEDYYLSGAAAFPDLVPF